MESESHGVSGMEFIPGAQFMFITIPRKHIEPHKRNILKNEWDTSGIPYEKIWNIVVVGDKNNLGFLTKIAPYVLWKQGNYGDWAQFCEIYGQPTELYKYDMFQENARQAAADVMKNSGGSRRFLFPKQLEFEMLDGKQSTSDGGLYEKLKDACNDEISLIVVGNTETSKASSSSGYAQAKVHSDQQTQIMDDDLRLIKTVLNDPRFIDILKSYGYPVSDGGYFEYEKQIDLDLLGKKKDIDVAVSKQVPVGDDYWYETYGIPKPDNYDELKQKMEEERAARNNPAAPPPKEKDPKPKKKIKLSFTEKLRSGLADFFGPGHKD
jgi:phage gp29-like protein